MDIDKLRADLAALLADQSLFDEANLHAREDAIDLIKYAGDVIKVPGYAGALDPLYQPALALKDKLAETNQALFRRVRSTLQSGDFTPESLREFLMQFTNYTPGNRNQADGSRWLQINLNIHANNLFDKT